MKLKNSFLDFEFANTNRESRSRGFTLIEILLAIAIFMVALAAIYSTWVLILRATQVGKEAAAQMQRQRIAVRVIEDSLTGIQSYQASPQYYSFNVENGDAPMLQFTARVPDDFPRSGRFGDFNVRRLTFSVEPVADTVRKTSENDLVLRQYPILQGIDPEEEATPFVLARNVQKFYVECWDTNLLDWNDEWLDTNSIPQLLRVTLTFGAKGTGNNGQPAAGLSVTRILAVPSDMMPASAQIPGRNTGGGSTVNTRGFGSRGSRGGNGGGQ